MPTIKVHERDLSWYYRQRQPGQITVLMPGVATFGPCDANEGSLALVNENNFTRVLGTSSVDPRDFSYNVAKSYVKSGIDVLFWRIPLPGQATAYYNFSKDNEASGVTNLFTGDGTTKDYQLVNSSFESSKGTGTQTVFTLKYPYKSDLKVSVDGTTQVVGTNYTFNETTGEVTFLVAPQAGKDIIFSYNVDIDLNNRNSVATVTKVEVAGSVVNNYTYNKETRTVSFNEAPSGVIMITYDYNHVDTHLRVDAKYPGAFGNNLSVKLTPVSTSEDTYRVLVYANKVNLVENVLVNFTDMDSEYYYTTVNLTTNYVEFTPGDTIKQLVPLDSAVYLENGSNGTYDPDAVTDYLSGVESDSVWSDLQDPLSRVFNVVTSAGYNNYNRVVHDIYITSVNDESKLTFDLNHSPVTIPNIEISGLKGENPEVIYYYLNENREETPTDDETKSIVKVEVITSAKVSGDYVYSKGDYVKVVANTTNIPGISQIDDRFIGLCESTGLSIYLVDGKQDWTAQEFYDYTSLPSQVISAGKYAPTGFNTSYAAAIGPWCSAVLTATGVSRMLPGSYVFLIQWAQSLASGTPMYYAPAGIKRASLNFVNSTAYPVGSAILELWQNHDIVTTDTHKVIPIANIRQYGYVIYGNSTLLKNLADGSTSMLQSLSTRIVANMIKATAFDISLTLQFDQISTDLFVEFRERLNMFMSQLKYNNALYDYEIVADTTNLTLDDLNSRTVPVLIRISPTPAAENFDITLEISQAGITFGSDDLQNTVTES